MRSLCEGRHAGPFSVGCQYRNEIRCEACQQAIAEHEAINSAVTHAAPGRSAVQRANEILKPYMLGHVVAASG
jgi:hypothetical protein